MREPRHPGRRRLSTRLLLWYALLYLVLIGAFSWVVDRSVTNALVDRLAEQLETEARLVAGELPTGSGLETAVDRLAGVTGARITIVATDGSVLADSVEDPGAMGNIASRPEIAAALGGEVGAARRPSATPGDPLLYVAIPSQDGMVVRLSVTEDRVSDDLAGIRSGVVEGAVLAGILGVIVVAWVARLTVRPLRDLTETAGALAGGRIELRPPRSDIYEIDRLGVAMGQMATQLGGRLRQGEEERKTLEVILEALPQGVILVGLDDQILYGNRVAAEVAGGQVPGRLQGLTPHGLQTLVRDARGAGEASSTQLELVNPPRVLRAVATPFGADDRRVLLVVTDITERHRMEAIRRDFVADASHELKTPVSSILASAEALQLALTRDPQRAAEFASGVEESARRLARIVADLLDLSRLETARVETQEVELEGLVLDEVARFRALAEEAGISLTVEAESAVVAGAPAEIALAVRNLCENAIRYTDRGGSVHVTLERRDRTAMISVVDTGVGIPSRALPRVFERFFRVDVARSRATGGTGLGLSMVRHAIERNGGTVSVSSELGVGSTFVILLPLLAA